MALNFLQRNARVLEKWAERWSLDALTLAALIAVECPADGMLDGSPIIRFEVHTFLRRLPPDRLGRAELYFRVKGPKPWQGHEFRESRRDPWEWLHTAGDPSAAQRNEQRALAMGKRADRASALEATAWGMGRVMGYHWPDLGYHNVYELATDATFDQGQLQQLLGWLELHGGVAAIDALRRNDFPAAAELLSPKRPATYARKLEAAYAKFWFKRPKADNNEESAL